ncbi:MAG: CoA ester lyase [Planctomycetaceae bacterium]|nr:MAG: CoA ester lyase [Planctomycetaceae bacterium]
MPSLDSPYADFTVWRSMLFVPVNVRKYVDKAHERGADAIILDLEDSIAPNDKATARELVADTAPVVARGGADVIVRINRPLELAIRDIEAVVSTQVEALMIPKLDSASHVRLLAELVGTVEKAKSVPFGQTKFIAMVETAAAFPRIFEIAAAHPRVVAITLGGEDIASSMGAEPDPDVLLYPKQQTVLAARAAGIAPIGTIGTVADFSDVNGYREIIKRSVRFGFEGSACIHPSIVPLLNEGFTPDAEALDRAKRMVAAYRDAFAQGRGSVTCGGKMIDVPVVERAQRLIDRSQRLSAWRNRK